MLLCVNGGPGPAPLFPYCPSLRPWCVDPLPPPPFVFHLGMCKSLRYVKDSLVASVLPWFPIKLAFGARISCSDVVYNKKITVYMP